MDRFLNIWDKLPPAVAAFLRLLLSAVLAAIITAISGVLVDYQTPQDAGTVALVVLGLLRVLLEGLLDELRAWRKLIKE